MSTHSSFIRVTSQWLFAMALLSSPTRAQDIAVEQARIATDPVEASPASVEFATAQQLHAQGQFVRAAVAWHRVETGVRGDEPNRRAIAGYMQAIALFELGLVHASLTRFGQISANPGHPMHAPTLLHLGKLARRLVDPNPVVRHLARYSWVQLDQATQSSDRGEAMQLAYLLGRSRYLERDYPQALALLGRVDVSSPNYPAARLFESASHVRERRSVLALQSLQRAEAAILRGEVSAADPKRWLDLVHLSMGRIYYTSAIHIDAETNVPSVNSQRFSAAAKYYELLQPESEYFPDATLELAWVYFMSGDFSRALGHIHTLDAPYFPYGFYPEADMLKAVAYFANCDYERATILVARFMQRYIPWRRELERLVRASRNYPPGTLTSIIEASAHEPQYAGSLLESLNGSLSRNREYLRARAVIASLNTERGTLQRLNAEGWDPGFARELSDELAARQRDAQLAAERLIASLLQRRIDAIDEHMRHGRRIVDDISHVERNLLDTRDKDRQREKRALAEWISTHADESHVLWPFDGEYWRDELGTYRQAVLSVCWR